MGSNGLKVVLVGSGSDEILEPDDLSFRDFEGHAQEEAYIDAVKYAALDWQDQKVLALGKLCEDEHLDRAQFKALMDAYIYSGQEPIKDEVYKCLDNRPSILHARTIGERIIAKMKEFVEVFVYGMVA